MSANMARAGTYTIIVSETESDGTREFYFLKPDNTCVWEWHIMEGEEVKKGEMKGTWNATDNCIEVRLTKLTGIFIETYQLEGGRFVNTIMKNRYLVRWEN